MDEADVNCFEKAKCDNIVVVKNDFELDKMCDTDQYITTNKKLGIALIFGQIILKGFQKPRTANEVDQHRIFKALKDFGFDVRNYIDQSVMDIKLILEQVSKEDHSNNDCLVVVVMSHGEKDRIHASDAQYPVNMLWHNFLGDSCPTLLNKPKFFFVQACRGIKLDKGVSRMEILNQSGRTLLDCCSEENKISFTIPSTADLLIMYSTFNESISFRNTKDGSWFIQCLAAELEQSLECGREIHDLLRTVSRKVAYMYQSYNPKNKKLDQKKQMPTMVSTLTKFLYLAKKV